MIVVDASVVADALVGPDERRHRAMGHLVRARTVLAPTLLDAEVLSVLRKMTLSGALTAARAAAALSDLATFPVERLPLEPLLARAFELRDNLSAYDALYLATAESVEATLLTRDGAFVHCPGRRVAIELLP